MKVKVLTYSPVKGKGVYELPNGNKIVFRHTMFASGMFTGKGELKNGKLHKQKTFWEKLFRRAK